MMMMTMNMMDGGDISRLCFCCFSIVGEETYDRMIVMRCSRKEKHPVTGELGTGSILDDTSFDYSAIFVISHSSKFPVEPTHY